MKARTWFEARGRSARSRGLSWEQCKRSIGGGFYRLPRWAQSAIARGYMVQGFTRQKRPPSIKLWHVDDCMYVAAHTAQDAALYVQQECGDGCGDLEWVTEAWMGMPVTRANVEDGEEATPDTMTTAQQLLDEHLQARGEIPATLFYDGGM